MLSCIIPTRLEAPALPLALEFQGEGAMRLLEKKLSIAFWALTSTSLSGLQNCMFLFIIYRELINAHDQRIRTLKSLFTKKN